MRKISILALIATLSGCQQYLVRSDFVDDSAGDAIARNNANQMVDPWNTYVYDTDIATSGERQAKARKKYTTGEDDSNTAEAPPTQ